MSLNRSEPVFGVLQTTKMQTSLCTQSDQWLYHSLIGKSKVQTSLQVQSDQRLCHSLIGKYHIKVAYFDMILSINRMTKTLMKFHYSS